MEHNYKKFLEMRPLNVVARWGAEDVALVSGRDVFATMKECGAIALAANARHPLTVKGILKAAKKLDAAVLIEIAKSETNYCGGNFDTLPEAAVKYSAEMGHGVVFALHVDHYAIKGQDDVLKAVAQMGDIIRNGWTSVAIDASHLEDWDNLCATRDVAMHIPPYFGLEVEVGEIKGPGELSTVEEADYFIGGLNAWGIFPDLLAISNGSLHGMYDTSKGQSEGIDLQRTKEIADSVGKFGVSVAQHGISGTPISKCTEFTKYGINKGNVATLFQNVLFGIKMDPETGNAITENGSYVKEANRGIPVSLWEEIVSWCDDQGYSRKDGNYKKANLPFYEKIASMPQDRIDIVVEETQYWAERFIKAFNAEGTASRLIERVCNREGWNPLPERKITECRDNYKASDAPAAKAMDGQDYSD